MQKKDHVPLALGAVIASAAVCLLSFAADWHVGVDKFGLFARSGGLLTLAAAVLEYQLWVRNYLRNAYKPGSPTSLGGLAAAANLPSGEQKMKNLAHGAVAVGTLIWAYGDLIFKVI